MTYDMFTDRDGRLYSFDGTDEDLTAIGSFVLQSGGRQAVSKILADGTWRAWERVPEDASDPLGEARVGALLGDAKQRRDSPHLWGAHQRIDGSDAIGDTPSHYGTESLGAAVNELLRLGKPAS